MKELIAHLDDKIGGQFIVGEVWFHRSTLYLLYGDFECAMSMNLSYRFDGGLEYPILTTIVLERLTCINVEVSREA